MPESESESELLNIRRIRSPDRDSPPITLLLIDILFISGTKRLIDTAAISYLSDDIVAVRLMRVGLIMQWRRDYLQSTSDANRGRHTGPFLFLR